MKRGCLVCKGVSLVLALALVGVGYIFVVRGNDNITEEQHGFTDTTCTTKNYHSNLVYDNVSVGSASGSNYQVIQFNNKVSLLGNTTDADNWLENASIFQYSY